MTNLFPEHITVSRSHPEHMNQLAPAFMSINLDAANPEAHRDLVVKLADAFADHSLVITETPTNIKFQTKVPFRQLPAWFALEKTLKSFSDTIGVVTATDMYSTVSPFSRRAKIDVHEDKNVDLSNSKWVPLATLLSTQSN